MLARDMYRRMTEIMNDPENNKGTKRYSAYDAELFTAAFGQFMVELLISEEPKIHLTPFTIERKHKSKIRKTINPVTKAVHEDRFKSKLYIKPSRRLIELLKKLEGGEKDALPINYPTRIYRQNKKAKAEEA